MEQVIMEALFWKQVQIGTIAMLLVIAMVLSIWNLPWEAKMEATSSKKRLLLRAILARERTQHMCPASASKQPIR